jgi:LysM domain
MSGDAWRFEIRARLALALLSVTVAGCGVRLPHVGAPGTTPAPQSDSNWRGREQIRDAIADLNRGDARSARRRLTAVLRRQPGDGVARQLLAELDGDPRQLLGSESYSYTMRPGETLSTIAERALGNPMLFYALARYNNIAVPASVVPGQVIQVPGHRPAPPPPPRPAPRPASPRAEPGAAPEAPPVRPAPRAGNPAQAARLRGQGLAAMNAGAIDRAVSLLRQALALDPESVVIRNDLNRALRVQSTVRSRH